MRERQKKKKGRTWAEAAKTVLEKYPNTPMSHKEILQVIQRERLKEISGTSPLACLNAMLHTNSRGEEGIFYKVPGRMGVYTLKKDISDVAKELSEEESEESSDTLSDTQSRENNISQEGRRGRWMRRVPSKLQSQPSSPQPRCSSPSVPTSKLISPSQKHSKKALKQALKQQQQRNQRRQGGMPTTSSPRLLLKTIKDMADITTTDLCHPVVPRKVSPRSGRLNAGQLKRTKCKIDVETPDSILVNTNLRAIINKHTFSILPPECQQRLLTLLPEVDRQACMDGLLKVTSSALNNEFFTSAAQSWKERLAEGEFTPELQLRMRQETEKEKKVEHWKEAFFENYYGENSGLSFEDSKMLTGTDLNQESGSQPSPHMVALEDPKRTRDRTQADMVVGKNTVTVEGAQKPASGQKEQAFTTEPMKTRRSQLAEESKMNTAAQAVPTPEVARGTDLALVGTLHEKELKKEVRQEKRERPVDNIIPAETRAGLKEELASVHKSAEQTTEVSMETATHSEPLKRAAFSELEGEVTPEKRPRLSSVSSVSSISSVSPPASSTSSPSTPVLATNPRVPPLKIPVSRILSVPLSPSQVSPRTPLAAPLSSPVRTGARTLADIKAKAQLARAQRAAAAALSSVCKGAVTDPGPGGGGGEQALSSLGPSPTSLPASARTTAHQTSTPPSRPVDSVAQISLNPSQTPYAAQSDDRHKGNEGPTRAGAPWKESSLKGQESPSLSAALTRTGTYIPANNPLVTQLLQGKEVPLEQILPKPLSGLEVKSTSSCVSKGKAFVSAEHWTDKHTSHSSGRVVSDHTRHHRELPDKDTQEQILQALMQRKVQQSQLYGSLGPQHKFPPLVHVEEHQNQPRMSERLLGRKRMPKPAMTGHYLLNVSTYGRGTESRRTRQPASTNASVFSLKRESAEGEEAGLEPEPAGYISPVVSAVKIENPGYSVISSVNTGSVQRVKREPGSEDGAAGANSNGAGAAAKDTSSFSQSHRRDLQLCNSHQGIPQPYRSQADSSHQQPPAFQRTLDNQDAAAAAACYGGTISMSVPLALNPGGAGSGACTSSSETDVGGINGSVMSFSVTVTTIPAGHPLDHGGQDEPSAEQSFMESSGMEDVQSQCYCRLKAMIMCKGCGAFCHDDCIGPSKLCVSCLVVR
ncbi:putative Polycomb group protein ASXL2 isoform X2 [Takifugu rubripes]|uniref:ASXL transcriptional regulator 2 n=1 Tax=Takifugu rubripes TaxID=31033 RepID=A0A674PF31_TAKRU|nr:putative Polycomb group protein ASXL2 isoform X2 [Takifugu rubripes]